MHVRRNAGGSAAFCVLSLVPVELLQPCAELGVERVGRLVHEVPDPLGLGGGVQRIGAGFATRPPHIFVDVFDDVHIGASASDLVAAPGYGNGCNNMAVILCRVASLPCRVASVL